jgi:hypothetical protein
MVGFTWLQAWLAQAPQSVMQFTEIISLLNLYALKTRLLRLQLALWMERSRLGPDANSTAVRLARGSKDER